MGMELIFKHANMNSILEGISTYSSKTVMSDKNYAIGMGILKPFS
jgi:hypothetical protein